VCEYSPKKKEPHTSVSELSTLTNKSLISAQTSHIHPQSSHKYPPKCLIQPRKSRVHPGKSPLNPQKIPVYLHLHSRDEILHQMYPINCIWNIATHIVTCIRQRALYIRQRLIICIRKRALYIRKRSLYTRTREPNVRTSTANTLLAVPYISAHTRIPNQSFAKEPYISAKVPYVSAKVPYISAHTHIKNHSDPHAT